MSRLLACSLQLLAVIAATAAAQTTPARLELTERLRLDAAAEDFSAFTMNRQGNAPFYVGPSHEIVLPLPQDGNVRIYDSTGKRLKTIGGRGAGPGEFRNIFRLGWTRDTLWIYDASLRRIQYFGRDHALLRGTVLSDALRQPVQGDNPQVISDFAPSAIAAGGSVLGQIIVVNGRDPATSRLRYTYFVAAVDSNATVKRLAEIPPAAVVGARAYVPLDAPGRVTFVTVPFANDAAYAFSTAGDRFAIVSTNRAARNFSVTVRNGVGETLFSRAYPYTPRAIPAGVADSAADAVTKNVRQPPAVITRLREEARKMIPPTYPSIGSVVLARDGTTWVRTFDAQGNHQAMILDARGNVTATVALRPNIDIVEANGNRVWAVDTDADGLASVVVFTLRPQASR